MIHMAIPRQLGAWNPINRAVTFVKALAFADFESDTRQFESSETASQCGLFVMLAVPYVAMTAEDISYFQFLRKRPRAHYLLAFPNRIPRGRADIASLVSVTAPCV